MRLLILVSISSIRTMTRVLLLHRFVYVHLGGIETCIYQLLGSSCSGFALLSRLFLVSFLSASRLWANLDFSRNHSPFQ